MMKGRNGDPFWEHYGLLPSPFVSVKSIAFPFFFKRSSYSILSSIFSLTSSVPFSSFSYVIFWHSWEREGNAFPRVRNRVSNLTHSVTFTTFSPFLSLLSFYFLSFSLHLSSAMSFTRSLAQSVKQGSWWCSLESLCCLVHRSWIQMGWNSKFLGENFLPCLSILLRILFCFRFFLWFFFSFNNRMEDEHDHHDDHDNDHDRQTNGFSIYSFILLSLILYQEKRMKSNLTFSL